MNEFDRYEYIKTHECKHCLEKEQTFDLAQEFLQEVVKQLYTKEPLDENKLEHCLDELCFILKVKMETCDLNIQRPKKITNLSNWIEFNNSYLTQLAQK